MAAVEVMTNSWDLHREPYLEHHPGYYEYPPEPQAEYHQQYYDPPPPPPPQTSYPMGQNDHYYQMNPYADMGPPEAEYEERQYHEEVYPYPEPQPAYPEPQPAHEEYEPMMKGGKGGKGARDENWGKKTMIPGLMQHNDGPAITPVGQDDKGKEKVRDDGSSNSSVGKPTPPPAPLKAPKTVRHPPHTPPPHQQHHHQQQQQQQHPHPQHAAHPHAHQHHHHHGHHHQQQQQQQHTHQPPHTAIRSDHHAPRRHSPSMTHLPSRPHTLPPTAKALPPKVSPRQAEKVPTLRMLAQELGMSLSDEQKIESPSWRTHVLQVDTRHGEVEYYWYREKLEAGRPVYCTADRGYDVGVVVNAWSAEGAPRKPRQHVPEKGLYYAVLCVESEAEYKRTFAEKEDVERRAKELATTTLLDQSSRHTMLKAMQFTGAKFQHDGRKVTLWYTSTDRFTDYGPLVSPLFRAFGCRIWLQREASDMHKGCVDAPEEVTAGLSKESEAA